MDLKKAYDSVPHIGLFNKLRNLGLGGKLIDLIENIYKKTSCTIKNREEIIDFFNYSKGVRHG